MGGIRKHSSLTLSWSLGMQRSLSMVALVGLALLSALSLVTPAEAFGRCRHRQQCVTNCSPIVCGQPVTMYSEWQARDHTGQLCLTCSANGTWQPGNPCAWMDAGLQGHGCLQRPEGTSGQKRVYHGCGLHYDFHQKCWVWYSDPWSTTYCDLCCEWNARGKIRATLVGMCWNGLPCWDIYMED